MFILTVSLIVGIFLFSLYFLISKGKILIFPNILQPFLFAFLFFQIFTQFGPHNYTYNSYPHWPDWAEFTAAHIVRAVDFLDFLEEYGIELQNIKHNSNFSALAIIAMHWVVDIFLIALVIKYIKKRMHFIKPWWDKKAALINRFILITTILVLIFFGITVYIQKWRMIDIFLLWPLDNIIRVVDVGDTFQLFGWKLHGVEKSWWNSWLAMSFRLVISFYIAAIINKIWIVYFKGIGLTIEDLIANLTSEDSTVRKAAAEALGGIHPEVRSEAIPDLTPVLRNNNSNVRLVSVNVLEKMGPQARAAIPHLVIALTDKNFDVRDSAAWALKKIDPKWYETNFAQKAMPTLVKALKNSNPSVREASARVFGKIGHKAKAAIPYLIMSLKDQKSSVREASAKALGEIGPEAKKAIPNLMIALKDKENVVRETVKKSLDKIDPFWNITNQKKSKRKLL